MKILAAVLASSLVLLALVHEINSAHTYSTTEEGRNRLEEPFDPYPHPPFPQIDCTAVRQKLANGGCNNTESKYGDYNKDERVCAEIRIWYPSHCVMRNEHCTLLEQNFNLIGMCHKPRRGSGRYEKKVPYELCAFQLDYDHYCPRRFNEHICGVYMKSFTSMCHLMKDWCENEEPTHYRELAKVLEPKRYHSYMVKHRYYDKCGMYKPIAGDRGIGHFEEIVKPKLFKFDHVCDNIGKTKYKLVDGRMVSLNSYSYRKYYDYKKKDYPKSDESEDNCSKPTHETD